MLHASDADGRACRRRSTRCSTRASTSSTPTSARCSRRPPSRARSSTAAPSQALTPDEPRLTAHLTALVRKEFIRPDRPALEGEDGFRFRHLLLRDATYDAIPKATRPRLHERYADWLEQRAERLDAFVGYHLEQAYRYRVELRDTGPDTDALARRASEHLESAATAALGRSDFRPPQPACSSARRRLAARPRAAARAAADRARRDADGGRAARRGGAHARRGDDPRSGFRRRRRPRRALLVERQFLDDPPRHGRSSRRRAGVIEPRVIPILERRRTTQGPLPRLAAQEPRQLDARPRLGGRRRPGSEAAEHARRPAMEHERAEILVLDRRLDVARARCRSRTASSAARRSASEVRGHPACEAEVLRPLGGLHGFAGRFELARSLFAESNATCRRARGGPNYARALAHRGLRRDARRRLRRAETLAAPGLRRPRGDGRERAPLDDGRAARPCALRPGTVRRGRAVHRGRASELAEPDDLVTQIVWRASAPELLARGRHRRRRALAREAVDARASRPTS